MAGDRVGVFVSNEDLTVGIVGQPVDGIIGYDPASGDAYCAEYPALWRRRPRRRNEWFIFPLAPAFGRVGPAKGRD